MVALRVKIQQQFREQNISEHTTISNTIESSTQFKNVITSKCHLGLSFCITNRKCSPTFSLIWNDCFLKGCPFQRFVVFYAILGWNVAVFFFFFLNVVSCEMLQHKYKYFSKCSFFKCYCFLKMCCFHIGSAIGSLSLICLSTVGDSNMSRNLCPSAFYDRLFWIK